MTHHAFLFWALILAIALNACKSTPESTEVLSLPLPTASPRAALPEPDTAGLHDACRAFLQSGRMADLMEYGHPLQLYPGILMMTSATSGVFPCNSHFDDSLGFHALHFQREHGVFRFYCPECPGKLQGLEITARPPKGM